MKSHNYTTSDSIHSEQIIDESNDLRECMSYKYNINDDMNSVIVPITEVEDVVSLPYKKSEYLVENGQF